MCRSVCVEAYSPEAVNSGTSGHEIGARGAPGTFYVSCERGRIVNLVVDGKNVPTETAEYPPANVMMPPSGSLSLSTMVVRGTAHVVFKHETAVADVEFSELKGDIAHLGKVEVMSQQILTIMGTNQSATYASGIVTAETFPTGVFEDMLVTVCSSSLKYAHAGFSSNGTNIFVRDGGRLVTSSLLICSTARFPSKVFLLELDQLSWACCRAMAPR